MNHRPPRKYDARFAALLATLFFLSLSFPVLVELPGGVSPGQILMLIGLPVWLAAALDREGPVLDPIANLLAAGILLCCGALILWSLVSAFHVDVPFRAARPIISLLTAFALYFLVVGTVTSERLFRYAVVLCFALAFTSAVTIGSMAIPELQEIIFRGRDRAFGFFKNPNQFGIAISTVLPVTLGLLFSVRRRRVLWIGCTLALALGLMASGSKANLLVTAVTVPTTLILFTSIMYTGQRRVMMIFGTAIGCLVVGFVLISALSIINPRALSLLGDVVLEGEATHSLVSRSVLWTDSIALMQANPVVGVGAGERIHGFAHSHNIVLEYARTLGAPGLVLILTKILILLTASTSGILFALRAENAPIADRVFCIGMAVAPISYIGSNFSSDSLGPTTSPFLYSVVFLGLASRRLLGPQTVHDYRGATV